MKPPVAIPRPKPPLGVLLLAVALLATHFGLAVGSKREASTTSDELVHLTAGVSYWRNHDYRLHPENGNLPQRWAALPVWLGDARFPDLVDNEHWRNSDAWIVGRQFFYETGEDHFPRLMAGRAMIALFSVATGALVFAWSWRFFRSAGALVSLTLFAFSPDFLAHGALVTSDATMAFFFLAAVWAWWTHLHDRHLRTGLLSAFVLGLACVAKYSAVLLGPMMVAMAAVRAWAPTPWRLGRWQCATPAAKLAAAALSGLAHAAVGVLVVWASFGFRYAAFNPALPAADGFIRPWVSYVGQTGLAGEAARSLAAAKALPEAFLYGFDYVLATTKSRAAFLNGEHSVTGWRTFFLWTFLLKTTLPLLLVALILLAKAGRRLARGSAGLRGLYAWTPLLVLLAVYGATSVASRLNIGHRHILPLYPVLFIAAGSLGAAFAAGAWRRGAVVAALLAWHAGDALRSAPHHLAYFNPLAGGPPNGWRHLVDSSLDWGQDLPALKKWISTQAGAAPVYLSYFGTAQPDYYQLDVRRLGFINNFRLEHTYVPLEPGAYCISATILQQVYTTVPGPWTPEREKEYQELRVLEPLFARYAGSPADRAELEKQAPAERWQNGIRRHESLRLARLTAYLRARGPDANAGHSILIFNLNAEEIRAATAGTWSEWNHLIDGVAAKKP
ncbi:MAG: glycosyltransferase family 39 protein [Opitutaceae bacterium]|nr:glycosyltransferase family 39 protein [Opitutaceae bacterium]